MPVGQSSAGAAIAGAMGDTTGTGTAEATTHVAVPATTPITIIEPKRFNVYLLTQAD